MNLYIIYAETLPSASVVARDSEEAISLYKQKILKESHPSVNLFAHWIMKIDVI